VRDDQREVPVAVRLRLPALGLRPAQHDLRSAVLVRAGQARNSRRQRGQIVRLGGPACAHLRRAGERAAPRRKGAAMSVTSPPGPVALETKQQRHARLLERIDSPGFVDDVFEQARNRRPELLIGGDWVVPRSGATADTYDPSSGNVIGQYAVADAEDVDRAVQAAKAAHPAWAALTMDERAQYMARLA